MKENVTANEQLIKKKKESIEVEDGNNKIKANVRKESN